MKTKSKPSIPEIVYRVSDLVASMLKEVNIGTNLAMAPGPSEGPLSKGHFMACADEGDERAITSESRSVDTGAECKRIRPTSDATSMGRCKRRGMGSE